MTALARKLSRFEPAIWFLLTFGLYVGYGAETFYKTDGPDLLWLFDVHRQHPWHVGYLPAFTVWHQILHLLHLDGSMFRVFTSFSALGMATGVAMFVAGLRRLCVDGVRRASAALLLAACPAAMLFGCVVELHAPLMAVVGLAFFWTTVQIKQPTVLGMICLSVLTHCAFLMHSSGLLLPAWLLPFFLARRRPIQTRDVVLSVLAGSVHVVLFFVLPRVFPGFYGVHADLASALAKESSINRPQSIDYAGVIFLQEWLWPLLPVSATCFFAVFRRSLRAEFFAFLIGLCPFLYLCVRQLVFEKENGAYLLPMMLPAVLLTVASLPQRVTAVLAFISVLLALSAPISLRPFQPGLADAGEHRRFVQHLEVAAQNRPFLVLVGTHREMSIGYERLLPWAGPGQPLGRNFLSIRETAAMPRTTFVATGFDKGIVAELQKLTGQGAALLMPQRTRNYLLDPAPFMRAEKATSEIPPDMAGPALLQALEAAFAFIPIPDPQGGGDPVFWLRPN